MPKFLLVMFILCTIVSGLYSTIPIYESPSAVVITDQIPEYQLSITNDSWVQPERILLANLTPKLEDPSWFSSEWRQGEYDARVETINDTTTLYFNNQTAVNETYTWSDHAGWDLLWPFAVLNYTELTAEWHIRVLNGNITVDSLFTIARGITWIDLSGHYVPDSSTEMKALAGDAITLVSTASNFTERFSNMELGLLRVGLDIHAAQGSIVVVDNVEVWISTDEPLCQITMDFQSLYGFSLLSNPSIISQWLGTSNIFSFDSVGEDLSLYLKSYNIASPYGYDLMLVTKSNQTMYLTSGNYNLSLGWSDMYYHDEFVFDMIILENSSVLMNIPLPFNQISIEMSTNQIPGEVGVNQLNRMNISESEGFLLIIPECSSFSLRLAIPGIGVYNLDIQSIEGAWSIVFVNLEVAPLLGIFFAPQQISGITVTSIFAIFSLVLLLYRWRESTDASYLTLVPLGVFVIGLISPWYIRTEIYSGVEYTTYVSPILGYRFWHLDNLFLTTESILSSQYYLQHLIWSLVLVYTLGFFTALVLFNSKTINFLFFFSILLLVGGVIPIFTLGGIPWLGFGLMISATFLSYLIRLRSKKDNSESSLDDIQEQQTE
ncbi:MAG: hypothetical protein ACFFEL_09680 [Candidatus Thorarchaeota archaeon]